MNGKCIFFAAMFVILVRLALLVLFVIGGDGLVVVLIYLARILPSCLLAMITIKEQIPKSKESNRNQQCAVVRKQNKVRATDESENGAGCVLLRKRKNVEQRPVSDTEHQSHQNSFLLIFSNLQRLFGFCRPGISIITLLPATPHYLLPNEGMRSELMRLISLATAGLPPEISLCKLAHAGYYYDRREKRVRCFSCGRSHGQAHAEDCDRVTDNIPFPRSLSLPSPSLQHWPHDLNVVRRYSTPGASNPEPLIPAQVVMGDDIIDTVRGVTVTVTNLDPSVTAAGELEPSEPLGAVGGGTSDLETGQTNNRDNTDPVPVPQPSARGRCRQCRLGPADIKFLPCGHITSCARCSNGMAECDVCHQRIEDKVYNFQQT